MNASTLSAMPSDVRPWSGALEFKALAETLPSLVFAAGAGVSHDGSVDYCDNGSTVSLERHLKKLFPALVLLCIRSSARCR